MSKYAATRSEYLMRVRAERQKTEKDLAGLVDSEVQALMLFERLDRIADELGDVNQRLDWLAHQMDRTSK